MAVGLFSCTKEDVGILIKSGTYEGELKVTWSTCYPDDTISTTSVVSCLLTFNNDGTGVISYPTDSDFFTWGENLTIQKSYLNDIEIVGFAYVTLDMDWSTYGYGSDTLDLVNFDYIYECELEMEKIY